MLSSENGPVVFIIVPARNEEACLGRCLESLVTQTGIDFEIIVVDDASTDRTGEIARSFSSVRVISAPPLPEDWTGKNNAMAAGVKVANGKWLLFTDADTVHKPGSLAKAVAEAEQHGAALLSYSPEQEVRTFWEKAVMPVIFAELAATYPPSKVNDPTSPIAAANGQYLLISREAYDAVGGHAAIANSLLEDVALARLVKSSGRRIFFRYGGDAVRTRMYRSWPQMKEGWTKNLALLFFPASSLACLRSSEAIFIAITLAQSAFLLTLKIVGSAGFATLPLGGCLMPAFLGLLTCGLMMTRVRKAHFPISSTLIAVFGLPVFAHLLFRSARLQKEGKVVWKERNYKPSVLVTPRWFKTLGGPFLIATILVTLTFTVLIVIVTFHEYLFHRI